MAPYRGERITTNWEAVVGTKPEDQIFPENWVLNRLKGGKGFVSKSGGDFLTGPIEYAENTNVKAYSDMGTFEIGRVDVFDRWEAEWKEYIGPTTFSAIEEDRNGGEGEVFALVPAKLENTKNTMLTVKNRHIFGDGTADSGAALTGLLTLVPDDPTTGTRQGISAGSFSFWRSQQTSGAMSVSAFDQLRAAMRTVYNLCSVGYNGTPPSFGVTTLTVFQGFESLLVANERFHDKKEGDGGYQNERILFKGMKLAYDNACGTGRMYFLSEKFLKLYYIAGRWMKMLKEVDPANQTITVHRVRSVVQLATTQPRRLGVVTAIT